MMAIPLEAAAAPLGLLAEIRPSNVDKKSQDGEVDVRLCNYTDVYHGDRIWDSTGFMQATATPDQISRFRLLEGDVLVTKDSESPDDIGVPAMVAADLPGTILGYHTSLIRPNRSMLEPRYLYWALRSRTTRSYFEVQARGITRFALRTQDVASTPIPLPGLEEQRRIADMLDRETARIDTLIAHDQAAVRLASERRSAIAHAALSDSTIQDHWTVGRADWLVREVDERLGRSDEELPLLSVSEYRGIVPRPTGNHGQMASEDVSHYKVCKVGDVVLNKLWGFRGGIATSTTKGLVSPDYAVLRPLQGANPRFLHHLFRSPRFVHAMAARSRGVGGIDLSAGRSPRINMLDFRSIPVAFPSETEQAALAEQIDAELNKIDRIEVAVERQVGLLMERREALISAVVTGVIDV